MTQKLKQIIIVVVIIVVAFVGFKMFFGDSESGDTTLIADNASQAQFVDGQAILLLLNKLNKVRLDVSVFAEPVFTSLVSFAQPIPDEIIGRNNPFAPIGN